jgi:hypothetical protein
LGERSQSVAPANGVVSPMALVHMADPGV